MPDTIKNVFFIQGGGKEGYEADQKLVASLQTSLTEDYKISYPELQIDEAAPDFGWLKQIGKKINEFNDGLILVAHSLGASLLLKYLSENKVSKNIAGIFLLATPYWSGDEKWVQGLKLDDDFQKCLPKNSPFFFYQCRDDKETPFAHFITYSHKVPGAIFREIESGGHQFNNDLSLVARDIKL